MFKIAAEPITAISGLPGHGKTLLAVQLMDQFKKEGLRVFHLNIPDLVEDFAEHFDRPIEEWHTLPKGSVLVVDECHNSFPKRPQTQKEPPWLAKLAEIRHLGIRLILITQDFRDVDAFVRRRIGCHLHVSNKTGHEFAVVHESKTLVENPKAAGAFRMAEHHPWRYPKHLYGVYKSSTMHLRNKKMPFKLKVAAVALVLLVGVLVFLSRHLAGFTSGDFLDEHRSGGAGQAEQSGLPSALGFPAAPSGGPGEFSAWASVESFAKAHTPLVPGVPWSAPVFSGSALTTVPDIHCVIIGDANSHRHNCRCYSEQVTPIDVDRTFCRDAARHGVYNPYRRAAVPPPGQGPQAGGAPSATPPAAPIPGQDSAPQVRAYAAPPPVAPYMGVR